ncbi:MAG: STAS domain-containing protein [Desulfobacterales bacterium]|nr:STAS domain-containing protein [Desulfobacterales bacterium]
MQKIPIIKIGENLIVSLQFDIDDSSAVGLQGDLLLMIQKTGATGVLVELSALDMVDSFMGRMLSDITRMSATMNANTVIVGIQPSVAITLVELGLRLEGVHTALNVEAGIALLEKLRTAKAGSGHETDSDK